MTPGLAHIFCRHGICKGFVSMTTAESPQIFTNILTRRLPKTVQVRPKKILVIKFFPENDGSNKSWSPKNVGPKIILVTKKIVDDFELNFD